MAVSVCHYLHIKTCSPQHMCVVENCCGELLWSATTFTDGVHSLSQILFILYYPVNDIFLSPSGRGQGYVYM